MSEENKTLIRRYYEELFNKGNLSVADELITPDFVSHALGERGAGGPEGVKQFVTRVRTGFPNFNVTIEDQLADDDKVVTRFRMSGTHNGQWMGAAPTGKQVTTGGIWIHRIAEGKIVERWGHVDRLGMAQQMGVIPTQ